MAPTDLLPASGNLYDALRAGFPADLDRPALALADGRAWRWRDLDAASGKIANLLLSLDLPPEPDGSPPRLMVQTEKSPEALLLFLAALRAGFIHVPLNPAYQGEEMQHFIEDARPAVLVCSPAAFPALSTLGFQRGVRHVYTLGQAGEGTLIDRASFQPEACATQPCTPGQTAALIYTSGTTGRSKGAELSHAALLANARTVGRAWGWTGADVLVHALPIFHIHGLFVAAMGALLHGSTMRWLDRFEPQAVRAQLPGASLFMGVPTMYSRLLREPGLDHATCASLRLCVSGSAPLSTETFAAWEARTGHRILERYGMSEAGMIASNPLHGERRPATVGPALPGVDLRVVDAGDRPLPAGETGAVQVAGPSLFDGYWRQPAKTAEAFVADADGRRWFRTGDLGRLDATGVLTLDGRGSDLIISGGFNVYPAEIEQALDSLPGVAESAVIGVPHPDFGEGVLAVLVASTKPPPEDAALLAALRQKLAAFKCPKAIVWTEALPRNAMGKVQKKQLREQHAGAYTPGPAGG